MKRTSILRRISLGLAVGACAGMLAASAYADEHGKTGKKLHSINADWLEEVAKGKINLEGDHAAVEGLILARNIPIPYDYIATLMRTPNAFGQGPACIVCHSSTDPRRSYRGMDLSTCRGIKAGATEEPARPIFTPGKPAKRSVLGRRLRNNRMPLGAPFTVSANSDAVALVSNWIATGAKDDEHSRRRCCRCSRPTTPSRRTCRRAPPATCRTRNRRASTNSTWAATRASCLAPTRSPRASLMPPRW